MDAIGIFAARFVRELVFAIDWALGHWAVTMIVIAMLIYWVGRQKRLGRQH